MARRIGKRALTFAVSALALGAVLILFIPSVVDDQSGFSFQAIQDLLLGSDETVDIDPSQSENRTKKSKLPSTKGHPEPNIQNQERRLSRLENNTKTDLQGSESRKGRTLPQLRRQRNSPKFDSTSTAGRGQRGRRGDKSSKQTRTGSSVSRPTPLGTSQDAENDGKTEGEENDEDEDKPELGATISTPIAGKLMHYQTRKGVSGATLQVLVFHPLSSVPGAPQWVTAVAGNTNNDGTFNLSVEIPETPAPGAIIGLIFSHKDHKPVAGVPISSIQGGKATNLGVFWLGGVPLPLQGTINPSSIAPNSSIVDTGGLNPLAWDQRVRNTMLALFPVFKPGQSDFNITIGAQENDYENRRWMSLITEGQWLGSQSVKFTQVDVERDGQIKKEVIGKVDFILGPDSSVRGNVASKNGGALPGAVVTALSSGAAPPQVQIAGPNGDFRFEKPPAALRAFRVDHSDYLSREFSYDPRASTPQFELTTRRPNIPLTLTDSVTEDPIQTVSATLVGVQTAGSTPQIQQLTLSSTTGQYTLTASFAIANVIFRAEGYFESNVVTPDNNPSQALAASLTAARVVTQTAREAKARSGANNKPNHGIYWYDYETQSLLAYSQANWLEFEIDFGSELAAFDFELGARNFRIIDHKYHFEVQVDFQSMKPGRLSILAHQTETQTARLRLPPSTGIHRVRITWLNDRYIPGQLDANIVVDWVKFHQRPLTPEEQSAGQ